MPRSLRTDAEAHALAAQNLGLIGHAMRLLGLHQRRDEDDLKSVGYLALFAACRSWDPSRGALGTYAVPHIRWRLLRQVSVTSVARGRDARVVPLPAGGMDRRGRELPDRRTPSPDHAMTQAELPGVVEKALRLLPRMEREVIRRRFFAGHTLGQIGRSWSITKERVRQIEARALATLRELRPGLVDHLAD